MKPDLVLSLRNIWGTSLRCALWRNGSVAILNELAHFNTLDRWTATDWKSFYRSYVLRSLSMAHLVPIIDAAFEELNRERLP